MKPSVFQRSLATFLAVWIFSSTIAMQVLLTEIEGPPAPETTPWTVARQSSFTPPFALEHLEFDGPRLCGYRKCLFPLRHPGNMGYLAGRNDEAPEFFTELQGAYYNVSLRVIQEKHNMRHIYLEPPQIVSINKELRDWMRPNQTGGYTGQKHFPRFHTELVTQLVEIIPFESSLTFGCKGPRLRDGNKRMDQLFNMESTVGVNLNKVAKQARTEFKKLYRLLKDQPCLYKDFQIFLTTGGTLVHFDAE